MFNGREGMAPVRLLIAVLVMALAVTAAQAQMTPQAMQMQGGQNIGQSASRGNQHQATPAVKANDKAYNAALKNLPDKQFDPWHGVR
jgi:hypothetical protein